MNYHPKHGWQVECPECEGIGDGWDNDNDHIRCDHCDARGTVEAEIANFDGCEFSLHGVNICVHELNGALVTYDLSDDATPVSMDDLRPALPELECVKS